ncbi:MAG: hypothetical protein IIC64_18140, partial [SAR324 cluster bacterium]|nr:hypothetical protein [SAR324 cluster bacterium]
MKVAFLFHNRPDYEQRIPRDVDWVNVYNDADGGFSGEMLARVAGVEALIGDIRVPVDEQLLGVCQRVG